jgi:tetratricopeptide (TPR) repeat protein
VLTLRLESTALSPDRFRVELALEGGGLPRQAAEATFEFRLSRQDEEDLRGYLEECPGWPRDPAPATAVRVEQRLVEIGADLFERIFRANGEARELWASVQPRLGEVRVEIVAGRGDAAALPWELLRDPASDTALALGAHSFVRAGHAALRTPRPPEGQSRPLRILFVARRPDAGIPFRSVGARILKGLDTAARQACEFEVLRPATFQALGQRLQEAQREGRPFHGVQIDGPVELSFEDAEDGGLLRPLEGEELGKLLVESEVSLLVLGGCGPVFADAPGSPRTQQEVARARELLSRQLADSGVVGVLVLRFGVDVLAAAQFVADLYGALTCGRTLGEAVTRGRRRLESEPARSPGHDPVPRQDWFAPVVYEAAPLQLFAQVREEPALAIRVEPGTAAAVPQTLDAALPPTPEAGFFGRDEALLALDDAFGRGEIALLHGYAGSGKTATAAEFARWYALTGGVQGPVFFMSFGQHLPLPRLLDRLGAAFERGLEAQGIHWISLSDEERRSMALQILEQVPLLWVWDNVEPVTGFPAGSESAWSAEEQAELLEFLRVARGTGARFLLTSRRDEQEWLGDLPRRVPLAPLPMEECRELARALAEGRGCRPEEVDEWRPLLEFAQGNPLTLMLLMAQVSREGLGTAGQVRAFVEQLRRDEAAFADEAVQCRAASLGASLGYGFERAFEEAERRQLALLHLCQAFVDVDLLGWMGDVGADWCLPEVRGLSRETGIALLDRAAALGLLAARGGGFYSVHPVMRWFFRDLFDRYFAGRELAAERAFVEAMGELASFYHQKVEEGNQEVPIVLAAEEGNLLLARRLARRHGWWGCVVSAMQGLDQLYGQRGRRAEWKRLVEEIVPEFVDPGTDEALPDREHEDWSLVMQYRVHLAQEERDWFEAQRLQLLVEEADRERARAALDLSPEDLDAEQREEIRMLAVSLERLGHIRREQERDECVAHFEEALELADRIGDRREAAICAYGLGTSYMVVPAIRDLDRAEHWYRVSLERRDERDRIGRGSCLGQLGSIAGTRYSEARAAARPQEELDRHLEEAAQRYGEALDLLPADAADEIAATHGQLGSLYGDAGELDQALRHYRESIRIAEDAGNPRDAAETRFNAAFDLAYAGRAQDALGYAQAALRGFESFGPEAAPDVEQSRQLIERIQAALAESG